MLSRRRARPLLALLPLSLLGAAVLAASGTNQQAPPDPKVVIAAQREAMKALSFMDGVWRGPAWTLLPTGERHEVTQTERIGPFLDGAVKVIEGRGYNADGTVGFNALGIVSCQPQEHTYSMRSYAMGHAGDFALKLNADGYVWEVPTGPATTRYTAVVKDGVWHEVGDRIMPGKEPVRFFEMTLKRVSDTDWPAAGAVPPR